MAMFSAPEIHTETASVDDSLRRIECAVRNSYVTHSCQCAESSAHGKRLRVGIGYRDFLTAGTCRQILAEQ